MTLSQQASPMQFECYLGFTTPWEIKQTIQIHIVLFMRITHSYYSVKSSKYSFADIDQGTIISGG